jgi:hypothetical protein
MRKDPDKDFVTVNQLLGEPPSIFFLPANQIVPWILITITCYTLTQGFFSLGLPAFCISTLWLTMSWWLLTGKEPHKFTDKFRATPGKDWCNGNLPYISPLAKNRSSLLRQKIADSQTRVRLKPITQTNQQGQQENFMPFQNYQDLVCPIAIEKDGRSASGFLLNKGNQYQVVFGFISNGFHNILDSNEISNTMLALEEGFKELPHGERITIHTGCFSIDEFRQEQLSKLADGCELTPIAVLTRNEQKRVRELKESGLRQEWKQIIFCTWTYDTSTGEKSSDFVSKSIRGITDAVNKAIRWFIGSEKTYQEDFFARLLSVAFDRGFVAWDLFLNTKIGLDARACTSDEMWQWLWQKFNSSSAPPIPQLLSLKETIHGMVVNEQRNSDKHCSTVLIEGSDGRSSCPEHRRSTDTIWLPGKGQKCAAMVMAARPKGWSNQREQLRWLFKILSLDYVRDSEAVVEISAASDFIIEDNLVRQAKQSKTATERAAIKGSGRDVGAEVKADESFEAQKKLYKGAKAFHVAVTFFVYRNDIKSLDLACAKLSRSVGTAKILRERNIAWAIWLESLPTTTSWLLHSSSLLSDRRQTFDSETLPGVLPLTIPRSLDRMGVEFIAEGGKPTYIDLFHDQTSRGLITGESGSGKTVLGWQFTVEALVNNIPVVGMDISPATGSSFKDAIELLGDRGAYYDITKYSSNLIEIPDLRKFDNEKRRERLEQWKEFIRTAINGIVMGKLDEPRLAQRVDTIILKAIKVFLADPDIKERYNAAFEYGWKSPQWQQIPVLADFLSFCTKEQLNIRNYTQIDEAAINQIHAQITALLASRLGAAIGKPSSFSPEPAIKFFAFSGLNNEQDQYLMALNAQAACLRNALASPKSLFIGDELSVLFRKDGFANAIGELCAVGRKNGISVLLLAQDIDSICDCSAGAQIMQNMVYKITGRLTTSGAKSWVTRQAYDPALINQNASEFFLPDRSELCSKWLIEKNGRYWQTRFYPGEMILATVANNQSELLAKRRILDRYPNTLKGQLMGLKQFTDEYVRALKQGSSLDSIGVEVSSDSHAKSKPTQNLDCKSETNGKSNNYVIANQN